MNGFTREGNWFSQAGKTVRIKLVYKKNFKQRYTIVYNGIFGLVCALISYHLIEISKLLWSRGILSSRFVKYVINQSVYRFIIYYLLLSCHSFIHYELNDLSMFSTETVP